jgi:N-glycosidase YbiA
MTIYFYSDREQPYGCFSNFSAHGFVLDDLYWPTSEHYFQAQKFAGTPRVEQIRGLNKPKEAANMGRDRSLPLRSDWETVKDEVMRQAVLAKFRTHGEIRDILLGTGDEDLVENAPGDYYWGCGQDGTGQNKLGLILMEVRQVLCGWS